MKTLFTTLLLGFILASPPVWAQRQVNQTLPANQDVHIEVDVISGSINVVGWDRDEVLIQGTIGNDVEELEIDGSDNRISIDLDIPESWGNRRKEIDADLEISVPRGARMEIETISATIEAREVAGVAELASVSGSIGLSGSLERASVETVSGNIEIQGEQTRIETESVSGSIRMSGVSDSVEAATVSGQIFVTGDGIERASFESVAGRIEFSGSLAAGARLDAEIHSGAVVLELPADTSARFAVETFSGSIENEFGPEAERSDRYTPGKWLKFTTGQGDAEINIDSFSGTVELRKL